MSERILVTGANGFVGSALCPRLEEAGFLVRGAVRVQENLPSHGVSIPKDREWVVLHDQSTHDELKRALQGVHGIVHLAARVHVMVDRASDPLLEYRKVNRAWTEQLVRAAAAQGVRRFVFLSSIKVNGEQSVTPFTERDIPMPRDPYGVSKLEAEEALAHVSEETGIETVVVRSPLIYGPGVRGNFLQLMKILNSGIPLPLARIRNQRSLVYRGNLVDALSRCICDQRAAGRLYLVSDGEDLSTPDLIRRLGKEMRVTPHLWPLPMPLLSRMAQLAGKKAMIDRLLGSLQLDSSTIMRELDWHPPFSIDRGLAQTAAWFCAGPSALLRS